MQSERGSPFHSNLFVLKGRTVTRVHAARHYSCVLAVGGEPERAPLRHATAEELRARRLRRPLLLLARTGATRQHVAVPPVSDSALELIDTDLLEGVEPTCGAQAAPSGPPDLWLAECHDDRDEPYLPPEFWQLRAVSETKRFLSDYA